MFIYLATLVVIIFSIFGLTYSQTTFGTIVEGGGRLSTIQLPSLLGDSGAMETSLMENSGAMIDRGDNEIVTGSSQQSLEISSEGMEEANGTKGSDDETSKQDPRDVENNILDQNIGNAKQFGLTGSVWPIGPLKESEKAVKNIMNQKYASDGTKPITQKIHTNTIFNMIQYESFAEAMAVLQKQQEQDKAAALSPNNDELEQSAGK